MYYANRDRNRDQSETRNHLSFQVNRMIHPAMSNFLSRRFRKNLTQDFYYTLVNARYEMVKSTM